MNLPPLPPLPDPAGTTTDYSVVGYGEQSPMFPLGSMKPSGTRLTGQFTADQIEEFGRKCMEIGMGTPTIKAPEGWVIMPIELNDYEATLAQGALLDCGWDATTCFVARYDTLIRVTKPRRDAVLAAIEAKGTPK